MVLCRNEIDRVPLRITTTTQSHLCRQRRLDVLLRACQHTRLNALSLTGTRHEYLQEVLLTAHDASRSVQTAIPDRLLRRHARLVHHVRANHRPRAPETRLAVDRHGVLGVLDDRHEAKKLVDYASSGRSAATLGQSAVGEIQVVELQAALREALLVVGGAVQANDGVHVEIYEHGDVVVGRARPHAVDHLGKLVGAGEGENAVLHHPVHVAEFDALHSLIGSGIEVL